MRDSDCVRFLKQWLPRLGLRFAGYRRVRRTVAKRLGRRLRELGLHDLDAYGALLEVEPMERRRLDALCRIPISRFWRDRRVFEVLGEVGLPELAAATSGDRAVRCWSAGSASGEEPYSLAILWAEVVQPAYPEIAVSILATDADPTMLCRAARACYGRGSLKDLPRDVMARHFARVDARTDEVYRLRPERKHGVVFAMQDIRSEMPDGVFDLILCRNLVFTYFAPALQDEIAAGLDGHLRPGGVLVIGAHEQLRAGVAPYTPLSPPLPIFRKPGVGG